MRSIDDLIQDYLAALRILDLESPSILGHDATSAYRRSLLERIAELDKHSRAATPRQDKPRTKSRRESEQSSGVNKSLGHRLQQIFSKS